MTCLSSYLGSLGTCGPGRVGDEGSVNGAGAPALTVLQPIRARTGQGQAKDRQPLLALPFSRQASMKRVGVVKPRRQKTSSMLQLDAEARVIHALDT